MPGEPKKPPPNQIDAEPFRDYIPKPDKGSGEPFMAPGGWWVLVTFFSAATLYYFAGSWVRSLIAPVVDRWMGAGP